MSERRSSLETETNPEDQDSSEFPNTRSTGQIKIPRQSSDQTAETSLSSITAPNRNNDEMIEGLSEDRATENELRTKNLGLLLEQVLFFLAGLGSSIGYIATLSSLVYFEVLFGPNSFVYLNCAVFLPLLPVSLAQAKFDEAYDLLYQTRVTFLVRGVIGYGFVIIGSIGMISFADRHNDDSDDKWGLEWVIFWALLQGIGGAVLFGLLNQLASFVGSLHQNVNTSSNNVDAIDSQSDENETLPKKFKATVSAGIQFSALVVLMASVFSKFGTMNGEYFSRFLMDILLVEVLCFLAFLWLLLARPRIQASMMRRDSSMMEVNPLYFDQEGSQQLTESSRSNHVDDDNEGYNRMIMPLLHSPPSPDSSSNNSDRSNESEHAMLTLRELLYHSRLLCLGMALTLVPSFLVGSWFTHVQTNWMELAQILFYVRIGSDLVGRFATILAPPPSLSFAVWTAGLRCIAVVLFFANASSKIPVTPKGRDALSIGLVALIAFCSGYLVTSFYQLAPQQLPGTRITRAANVAKQSSILTVAFSVSAIVGLITSFVLVAIGV